MQEEIGTALDLMFKHQNNNNVNNLVDLHLLVADAPATLQQNVRMSSSSGAYDGINFITVGTDAPSTSRLVV